MSGCEFWVDDAACGAPVVETLVFVNQLINSHVHPDGTLETCAEHLAAHVAEHLGCALDA